MGWTHDDREKTGGTSLALREDAAARQHRTTAGFGSAARTAAGRGKATGMDPSMGIPLILRRRARWVSARLRHPRG